MKDFWLISSQTKFTGKGSGIVAALFLFIFNTFFAIGWLGMTWLYPAEIVPLRIRAPANALSTSANWVRTLQHFDPICSCTQANSYPGIQLHGRDGYTGVFRIHQVQDLYHFRRHVRPYSSRTQPKSLPAHINPHTLS